jgi:hypothetical protein
VRGWTLYQAPTRRSRSIEARTVYSYNEKIRRQGAWGQ